MSDDRLTHDEWAKAVRDGDLLGQQCDECGAVIGSPKAACVECGARALETVSLPTTGTVYTETTIGVAPSEFDGPYRVAVVDLGEARVLARLEGDAAIGDAVELAGVVETDDGDPAPLFS